jgi:hypothetical protein
MPWMHGEYTDSLTPDERADVQRLCRALEPGQRLPMYVQVTDFDTITLDGECSLAQLAAFVQGLERLQDRRRGRAH